MARKPTEKKDYKKQVAPVRTTEVTELPKGQDLPELLTDTQKLDIIAFVDLKAEEVKTDFSELNGLAISVEDYASSVGDKEAIRLLQKVLGIAKTGDLTRDTIGAWHNAHGKRELIDDYNNLRRDSYKDLSEVRAKSKRAIR